MINAIRITNHSATAIPYLFSIAGKQEVQQRQFHPGEVGHATRMSVRNQAGDGGEDDSLLLFTGAHAFPIGSDDYPVLTLEFRHANQLTIEFGQTDERQLSNNSEQRT